MLTRRIIPCLDVRDGRVVKGVRFSGLRDAGDPAERARAYEDQGADELVVLDVSATPQGRGACLQTIETVRAAVSIPVCVGGGVRAIDDALRLLGAGADKVALNTAAVERPEIIGELAERVGTQCVVVAIDAAMGDNGWRVVVRSGAERTALDAVSWARRAQLAGAGEVLLTSWDRDGTRDGYDLALLVAVSNAVQIPIIASGGANTPEDMALALDAGADAVLAASIFHEADHTVGSIKQRLAERGVEVRA